jgi:hypothetical protein
VAVCSIRRRRGVVCGVWRVRGGKVGGSDLRERSSLAPVPAPRLPGTFRFLAMDWRSFLFGTDFVTARVVLNICTGYMLFPRRG